MLDTVSEEDKVHLGVDTVVEIHQLIQSWDQVLRRTKHHVALLALLLEITEDNAFELGNFPVVVKVVVEDFSRVLSELFPVFGADQTISEDAVGLANVQLDEIFSANDILKLAHQHTLHNLTQITQVEGVMALRRRGQEVVDDILIDFDGGLDDQVGERGQGAVLFKREVALEDLREDLLHGLG